jgi:hypothetical protein
MSASNVRIFEVIVVDFTEVRVYILLYVIFILNCYKCDLRYSQCRIRSICVLEHIYRGLVVSVAIRTGRQSACEWYMKNLGIEVKDEH